MMATKRALFAGTTSYMGSGFDDLMEDLVECRGSTKAVLAQLEAFFIEVVGVPTSEPAHAAQTDIGYFINCISRFEPEFTRLLEELATEVTPGHVEALLAISERVDALSERCLSLKAERHGLSNSAAFAFWEKVYVAVREYLDDLLDLSNFTAQMKTFIGRRGAGKSEAHETLRAFHLKPNVFGVGINFNYAFGWVRRWWQKRQGA